MDTNEQCAASSSGEAQQEGVAGPELAKDPEKENQEDVEMKGDVEDQAVYDHIRKGNLCMEETKFKEAISEFTKALKCVQAQPEEAHVLCRRSRALSSMCKSLREIPASESEANALFGLDPFHFGQLALKDAQRVVAIDASLPEGYWLQASAYMLLEHYSEAADACLEGLSKDPFDGPLQQALKEAQTALELAPAPAAAAHVAKRPRNVQRVVDDFECTLCMRLLFEPVTTPCGHTFCKNCFQRATDHSNKCPMCRTVLHVGRDLPVTITLKNIIEKSFPEEYAMLQAEAAGAVEQPLSAAPIPLFVMSCMLPGEKMSLNIFEPRYRLMIRRCMEGNRRFGMATLSLDRQLADVACECEITECQPLLDGRYFIEVEGRRRFRLLESWEQDGYRIATPQFFADAPPDAATPEAAQTLALAAQVEALADQWVDRVKAVASSGRRGMRVLELLHRAGDKPPSAEHERLSFWVANLMPMDTADRLRLLAMTSTLERLQYEAQLLQQTTAGPGGCLVM